MLDHHLTRVGRLLACAAVGAVGIARAQVTLDGSLGPGGPVPLVNATYAIPDSVGRTVGNNLFHSFGQFNLTRGETAAFTGPVTIQNVLSRVTGGSPSSINGTIDSTAMPNANFFLINPAGVIFGPNAQIDVGGSFAVCTADYVKLADGGRFDARNPANDLLTVAAPSAFGFLGPTPAGITVNGATLQVGEGKTFSIIGGEIQIVGTTLTAASGRVNLIATGSSGEVGLPADDLTAPVHTETFTAFSPISIVDSSTITVAGDSSTAGRGGKILIRGADVTLRNLSFLEADNYSGEDGLGIEIVASGSITIADNANVSTFNFGVGNGGSILLSATAVLLANGAGLATDSQSPLRGGDIVIQTDTLTMENGAGLSSSAGGEGLGGDIRIDAATSVQLKGDANISATTFGGPSGNITIHTGALHVEDLSNINNQVLGSSDGGGIAIVANQVTLARDGVISVSTEGAGRAGNLDIAASSIQVNGANQSLATGLFATTTSFDGGNGGDILLHPGASGGLHLQLINQAQISTQSFALGNAGQIEVHATDVALSGGATIQSAAIGSGNAGSVQLQVTGSVLLDGKSSLAVSAVAANGGDIDVTAGGKIQLADSQITAQAGNAGGNVHLTTPGLVYLLNSSISAEAMNGNGGTVTIDPTFVILDHSQLNANAIVGNGGNIDIITHSFLSSDSQITASSEFGLQGNVAITAPDAELSGNLIVLETDLLAAESRLGPYCTVRLPGGVSSFVVTGRGGAPVSPDALLPASPALSGDGQQ